MQLKLIVALSFISLIAGVNAQQPPMGGPLGGFLDAINPENLSGDSSSSASPSQNGTATATPTPSDTSTPTTTPSETPSSSSGDSSQSTQDQSNKNKGSLFRRFPGNDNERLNKRRGEGALAKRGRPASPRGFKRIIKRGNIRRSI